MLMRMELMSKLERRSCIPLEHHNKGNILEGTDGCQRETQTANRGNSTQIQSEETLKHTSYSLNISQYRLVLQEKHMVESVPQLSYLTILWWTQMTGERKTVMNITSWSLCWCFRIWMEWKAGHEYRIHSLLHSIPFNDVFRCWRKSIWKRRLLKQTSRDIKRRREKKRDKKYTGMKCRTESRIVVVSVSCSCLQYWSLAFYLSWERNRVSI